MEGFAKTFQGHTALNLKHKFFFDFHFIKDLLPDLKKQTEDNVVGWVRQSFDILQVATQFFEKLKTVLVL